MQFIQGLGLDEVLEELKRLQPGHGRRCQRPQVDRRRAARSSAGRLRDRPRAVALDRTVCAAAEHERNGPAAASAATADQASARLADKAPPRRRLSPDGSPTRFRSPPRPWCCRGGGGATVGKKRPTYWQSVARIGVQVADALEYAHQPGRPAPRHQAVEPAARHRRHRLGHRLRPGQGRRPAEPDAHRRHPRHAPLHAAGSLRRPDRRRGDVYSLGLTLYELLALRPAFDEKERNRLIKQVTHGGAAAARAS